MSDAAPLSAAPASPPPLVAWCGLFAGLSMLALSVTGILWRINAVVVLLSVLAAFAISASLARHFNRRPACRWSDLLLLVPLLVIPTLGAFAPPYQWDEVAYGATLPRDYARAGRFFYNADYGPFSALPGNYEAVTTASLILVGHVAPARLFNVALAFGLAVIAMHLSLRLGVPRFVAPVAAVLVLGAAAVQQVALMVKNDIANAFFQALALLALADYAARASLPMLALAGFFLGTALGTKYSSLQFAVCVVPLALALVFRGARSRTGFFRQVAVFAASAVLAALPWYARNATLFGNPFYPFFNEALGARNAFTPEHSILTREMFEGLRGYTWSAGRHELFLQEVVSGFGWLPVLLSLPGLALAVTSRRSRPSLFLAGVFTSFSLLTLFAGYWRSRYFLSLLVLASAFAAVGLAEVVRRVRPLWERPRAAMLAVTALAAIIAAISLRQELAAHGGLIASLYRSDRQTFLESHVAYWTVANWINHNTSPGDKVGIGLDVKPFYYVERPYFHIHIFTEKGDLQARQTADEYLEAFRSLGLQWVAFKPWRPGPGYPLSKTPHLHAFADRFARAMATLQREGKIELVARLGRVRMYRMKTRPAEQGAP
jgi:4-amino-4-deoxy-L-arabinose transferase-like glycosyltransferase